MPVTNTYFLLTLSLSPIKITHKIKYDIFARIVIIEISLCSLFIQI